MKALVFVLTVLLLGAVGAGAWYWNQSTNQTMALQNDLKAAADEAANCKSEHEMLKQAVGAQSDGSLQVEQEREALKTVFQRYAVLRDKMDQVLVGSVECENTQRMMLQAPNSDLYQSFVASLKELGSNASAMRESLTQLNEFLASNRERLRSSTEVVQEVEKALASMSGLEQEKSLFDPMAMTALRENTFTVLANDGWQTSDLTVKMGEMVCAAATGKWRWGLSIGNDVGPEGEKAGHWAEYVVASNCPNGALLARVRGSTKVFVGIGSFEADRDGKIEYRINDSQVGDNNGAVDVTMWAFKPW